MPEAITKLQQLKGLGPAIRERILIELGTTHPHEPPNEQTAVNKINHNPYTLLTIPGIGMHRITTILQDNYGILIPEIPQQPPTHNPPQTEQNTTTPQTEQNTPTPQTEQNTTTPQTQQNTTTQQTQRNQTPPTKPQPQGIDYTTYPGIGPTLADRITTTLTDYYQKELNRKLTKHDIDTLIQTNPYRLTLVPGIGFIKADKIATQTYNIDPNDRRRHTHANRYLLQQKNGVMPLNAYRRARHEFGLHDTTQETNGIQIDLNHAWEPNELHAERILAAWGHENTQPQEPPPPIPPQTQQQLQKYNLNPQQTQAIWAATHHPTMALTGGAGTGKTTTIAALADHLSKQGQIIHLMAFSGKGSDRIAEALKEQNIEIDTTGPFGETDYNYTNQTHNQNEHGHNQPQTPTKRYHQTDTHNRYYGRIFVSTIHRGLAADAAGYFRMNDLAADLIIIDEASMIPNKLLASIIERMSADARLLLVGDPNQLPPIEYGAPFETLIKNGLPHHHLTQNYRQANQQAIHELAENIRTQNPQPLTNQPGRTITTNIPDQQTYDKTLTQTIQTHTKHLNIHQWQIVTATNATRQHTNTLIQQIINPRGKPLTRYREYNQPTPTTIRQGDKIVITRNDYALNIFNGQTGTATGIDPDTHGTNILINNKTITIPQDITNDTLRLGYAITTHKSQGSGWHTVIIAEPNKIPHNPNRWMYTSVTRAAQHIIILTTQTEHQWWQNTLNNPPIETGTLQHRIKKLKEPTNP
jgi:exodeoxyribonuclease V alpha subunit